MNGPAVSLDPGNKVTIAFTFNDPKDLLGKKENTIQESKAVSQRLSLNEQETPDKKKKEGRPPLMSRRTSSLLNMNIEGLLVVPEYEKRLRRGYEEATKRLRRNSYGGREEKKESGVDPLDGMMTTSLCTTEL